MTLFSLLASCSLRFTVLLFFLSDDRLVAVLILPSSRIRYRMMRYRYPVHTVSVAARSRLACFFASSHQLLACSSSYRSSFRRTGRVIVSPCHLPIPFNRIFDVASAACLPSPGMMVMSSHLVISSCGAVLRFLFACGSSRLPVSSHRSSSRPSSPRSSTRLGGACGGERPVSCLIGFCHAVCADVDNRFMRLPLGLLACRLGCGAIEFSSHPCGMCCDVLLACGSSRLSPRSSFRRAGWFISSLSSRLATRWAGRWRLRRCYSFSVSISCRLPRPHVLACLGAFLAIHLIRMAAGGWRCLSARRAVCLLACLVVSAPCLSSRRSPFMGCSIGAVLCRPPMLWV